MEITLCFAVLWLTAHLPWLHPSCASCQLHHPQFSTSLHRIGNMENSLVPPLHSPIYSLHCYFLFLSEVLHISKPSLTLSTVAHVRLPTIFPSPRLLYPFCSPASFGRSSPLPFCDYLPAQPSLWITFNELLYSSSNSSQCTGLGERALHFDQLWASTLLLTSFTQDSHTNP